MLFGVLVVSHDTHQDIFSRAAASLGRQQRDQSPSSVVVLGVQFQCLAVMVLGFGQSVQLPGEQVAGQRVADCHFVGLSARFDDTQETSHGLLVPSLLYGGFSGDDPCSAADRRALVQRVTCQLLGGGVIPAIESFLGPGQKDVRVGEIGRTFDQARAREHQCRTTDQDQGGDDQRSTKTTGHLVLLQRVSPLRG